MRPLRELLDRLDSPFATTDYNSVLLLADRNQAEAWLQTLPADALLP